MNRQRRSEPPRIVEALVTMLLPPSRREQVVGDLAERHGERQPVNSGPAADDSYPDNSHLDRSHPDTVWGQHLLHYILDAMRTLPLVWWTAGLRALRGETPRLAGVSSLEIQQRSEALGRKIRTRTLLFCFSFILWRIVRWAHARPENFFGSGTMHILWGCAIALVLYVLPGPSAPSHRRPAESATLPAIFPEPKSHAELLFSYRTSVQRELEWERKLLRPAFPAFVVMTLAQPLLPNWPAQPAFLARGIILGELFTAAYVLCLVLARLRARKLQKELGELDNSRDQSTSQS